MTDTSENLKAIVFTDDMTIHLQARMLARLNRDRSLNPEAFEYCDMVGGNVQREREARGLSRLDLALKSGVGDFIIQLLEHGLLHIDMVEDEIVEALAEALGVDDRVLFYPRSESNQDD